VFKLAKSAVEVTVFLFAAYAFVSIPLGKRTALQHTIAILKTKEAAEAGQELKQAGGRILDDLWNSNVAGRPELPKLEPPQSRLMFPDETDAGATNGHGVFEDTKDESTTTSVEQSTPL
jgi:hypothetical protein